MKNALKGLELNEKDNMVSAFTKVMAKGYIGFSAVVLPVMGALAIIGKCVNRKDEVEVFEEEMGAE
jgi:hypothetical protein